MGLMETRGECKFEGKHVASIVNREIDGISRWNRHDVQAKFTDFCPDVLMGELALSAQGRDVCPEILASHPCDTPLRSHLYVLMKGHFGSWVCFRKRVDKHAFLDARFSPGSRSSELVEYIAYGCISTPLQAATIESHLSAM